VSDLVDLVRVAQVHSVNRLSRIFSASLGVMRPIMLVLFHHTFTYPPLSVDYSTSSREANVTLLQNATSTQRSCVTLSHPSTRALTPRIHDSPSSDRRHRYTSPSSRPGRRSLAKARALALRKFYAIASPGSSMFSPVGSAPHAVPPTHLHPHTLVGFNMANSATIGSPLISKKALPP
jgi:hypothetical protein